MLHIVALLLGLATLWFVWTVSQGQEKFQPELLDRSQIQRTQEVEHSSYEQRTNHMGFMSFVDPAPGYSTPFRVNAYTAVRN
jgi:hypothetical protein